MARALSLCTDEGRGGMIGRFMAEHGDCLILHLPPEEFSLVLSLLVERHGKAS